MKRENNGKMRIIPLGGLEKIGMNITAFEYEDSIIVVDCGLSFPEEDMLGIDLVIPDVTYLKDNIQKVKGFVITHGHEDHIGALPYVLRELNLPIYATKLTMGIIEKNLTEREKLIIRLRYGVSEGKGTPEHPEITQREIAKQLGISRSYVSRIEKKALEKLRQALGG